MSTSLNPDPDLMRIFDFTAADFELNRAGRMSKRQAERLQKIHNKQRAFNLFAAIGLPLILLSSILIIPPPQGLWVFVILLLLMAFGMLFLVFVSDRKFASDMSTQKINYLEGEVKYWSGRANYGYIRINKHQLEIDIDTNLKLRDFMKNQTKSLSMRLYFSPAGKKVISAEILK